jgi:PhnB protein
MIHDPNNQVENSMQLIPYLSFNGQCEEAFKFYEKVLGGKITFMITWGESPVAREFPAESHKLIMHAMLTVGDQALQGADGPPDRYEQPRGVNVSIHLKDTGEGARIFNALADGGAVQVAFGKTFWSPGFGMCVDRFGIPWMVNCEAAGAV